MLVLLSLARPADAVIYIGNPEMSFRVDRPQGDYVSGSVDLDKVRVHYCSGSTTDVTVGQTIDPVAGATVPLPAGDLCAVTFYWSTDLDVDGPAYTVRYSGATTTVTLATDIEPVLLSPYSVVSGTMSGGGPWLLVAIE
jgi:hypothetical protein